jgi:1-phosphatidylinositol-4-phosphate 5-kinase
MLPAYYKHVRAFENALVTKFFGLHYVKSGVHQKKVRILFAVHPILMNDFGIFL